MRNKKMLSTLTALSLLASMCSMTGCGSKPEGGRIAVVCKNKTLSFWTEVQAGAQEAGKESGYTIDCYAADSDSDYNSQKIYIQEAIDNNVDAIVIAPNDPEQLNDVITKASQKGIKIININTKMAHSAVASFISSSDADGGGIAAKNALDSLTDPLSIGKIGLIGNVSATADTRIQGFKDVLTRQISAYVINNNLSSQLGIDTDMTPPELRNGQNETPPPPEEGGDPNGMRPEEGGDPNGVRPEDVPPAPRDTFAGNLEDAVMNKIQEKLAAQYLEPDRVSNEEDAYNAAKELLNQGVNILFATNTYTTLGMCRAVEEMENTNPGSQKDLTVLGFNSDTQEIDYIKNGILDGTVIQNPYNMGYISVRYAMKAINNESINANINTGVTFISNKNLDNAEIQLLLNPTTA